MKSHFHNKKGKERGIIGVTGENTSKPTTFFFQNVIFIPGGEDLFTAAVERNIVCTESFIIAKNMAQFNAKKIFVFILAAFIGVLFWSSLRFAFMPEKPVTHFHANFAMFINGARVDLTGDQYMEDVQGCKPEYVKIQPEERTHLHNNNMDVVHVHTDGVTWGHFMGNIGFAFGNNYLATDKGIIYVNDQGRTIKFILNGEQIENPFNRLIASEDRLLISFGYETVPQLLQNQYAVVAADAHEHNEHPDPGSCSGAISLSFKEKVRKAFWY